MANVLLAAYVALIVYFVRAYLPRPTAFGVIASLLWPISLALAVAWLATFDGADPALAATATSMRRGRAPEATS
jgi:hypothetical protein